VDPQRRYALFELQKQLAPSEPDVQKFVIGIDAVAKAVGYSPKYFRKRYFDVPASRQAVESGLPGYHTGLGHYYLLRGEPATHPSSAAAWGENIRFLMKQERQARAPGWQGVKACPVSAGSVLTRLS
jgi:hypothetical protein